MHCIHLFISSQTSFGRIHLETLRRVSCDDACSASCLPRRCITSYDAPIVNAFGVCLNAPRPKLPKLHTPTHAAPPAHLTQTCLTSGWARLCQTATEHRSTRPPAASAPEPARPRSPLLQLCAPCRNLSTRKHQVKHSCSIYYQWITTVTEVKVAFLCR